MSNDELKFDKIPISFTDKEKKLYELLLRRDETGKLAIMLIGVKRVLNDLDNPMRYAQAASTIRGIANELLEKRANYSVSYVNEDDLLGIKRHFGVIVAKLNSVITDEDDKDETINQANRQYKILENTLSFGARTRKMMLLDLLGHKKSITIIPKYIQQGATKLAATYDYFSEVLHRNHADEPEFDKNWIFFQDYLILVSSGFFDIAAEIQPYLEDETIQ